MSNRDALRACQEFMATLWSQTKGVADRGGSVAGDALAEHLPRVRVKANDCLQGSRTRGPLVRRPSRSRCASAAAASG